MSDEKNKNQDAGPEQGQDISPDQAAKNSEENLSDSISDLEPEALTEKDEESLLADIDNILAEEDPDFINQLSNIQIESHGIDLSIMDHALGLDTPEKPTILSVLQKPFEFKTNTKAVLIFWSVIVVSAVALVLVWKGQFGLMNQELFMTSFREIGDNVQEYNPITESENFYDNSRFSKNLLTLSPLHVNLKSSENSGPNPMLAIEFTVEGMSADSIIEIKDREAEFKDMMARLTEAKTYDDLVVPEGKIALCEQYRDAFNAHLTRGQVRRVLLKTFVIKP